MNFKDRQNLILHFKAAARQVVCYFKSKQFNLPGSALALTMFILAGMMIVAISGSYIVLSGIKSGGIQAQSAKAYFAAESGAERVLYEMRSQNWLLPESGFSLSESVFEGVLDSGASYRVFYIYFNPTVFDSIGEYERTKRNVELKI